MWERAPDGRGGNMCGEGRWTATDRVPDRGAWAATLAGGHSTWEVSYRRGLCGYRGVVGPSPPNRISVSKSSHASRKRKTAGENK